MMGLIDQLLTPPEKCEARFFPNRAQRIGGIWHCPHAKKIFSKGRARPACHRREVLDRARREEASS